MIQGVANVRILGIPVNYPAIELQAFWGFGVDDDACDTCWARYIRASSS